MSLRSKKKARKGIDIFLRLRPSKRPSSYWNIADDEEHVTFDVPAVESAGGTANNTRASHSFRFNGILGMKAEQDEVFSVVAKPPILSVMDGFNSTIFAYGQTGSGKTFTITGGPERYVDRGIIPRALSMMFDQVKDRSDAQFQIHISYLEIYNNQGYDLLDPSHETKRLEDLPRVTMREDEDGNVHLRGLSTHLASTEEDALNLLFLGDTNRAIAETPMNMASSVSRFCLNCARSRRCSHHRSPQLDLTLFCFFCSPNSVRIVCLPSLSKVGKVVATRFVEVNCT